MMGPGCEYEHTTDNCETLQCLHTVFDCTPDTADCQTGDCRETVDCQPDTADCQTSDCQSTVDCQPDTADCQTSDCQYTVDCPPATADCQTADCQDTDRRPSYKVPTDCPSDQETRGGPCSWIDTFDQTSLKPGWWWTRQDASHWSLADATGRLRITAPKGALLSGANNARNLLLRTPPNGDYEIETHICFTPTDNYHIAGLLIYEDDDSFLMVGRAFCDTCGGNKIYYDAELNGAMLPLTDPLTVRDTDSAFLRIVREGSTYSGYYSEDGSNWELVARRSGVAIDPVGIGIATFDGNQGAPQIDADFSYFCIREL